MPGDQWGALLPAFVDGHYRTLRGAVRTEIIHRQLLAHLPTPPATIVDVGGGVGQQSLPLARLGYRVTIVDSSPGMLERARSRLETEPGEVHERVTLVESSGEDAPDLLDGSRFDAVLCHGVLMYLADPDPMLDALAALTAPGGVVSIAARNRHAMAVRPALQRDWAGALAAFDAPSTVNGLGLDARGDTVEELTAHLRERQVETVAWYGVRLFTDGWISESAEEPTADLLAVEFEASWRDPYRQLSRLFHVIGRRVAIPPLG